MSTEALIQRILTLHVIRHAREAGFIGTRRVIDRLGREQVVLETVVRQALELNEQGRFTEHFTLTVFRDLIADAVLWSDYEIVIERRCLRELLTRASSRSTWNLRTRLQPSERNSTAPFLFGFRTSISRHVYVRIEPIQSLHGMLIQGREAVDGNSQGSLRLECDAGIPFSVGTDDFGQLLGMFART